MVERVHHSSFCGMVTWSVTTLPSARPWSGCGLPCLSSLLEEVANSTCQPLTDSRNKLIQCSFLGARVHGKNQFQLQDRFCSSSRPTQLHDRHVLQHKRPTGHSVEHFGTTPEQPSRPCPVFFTVCNQTDYCRGNRSHRSGSVAQTGLVIGKKSTHETKQPGGRIG
jgi:hypothetical protein